MSDTLSSAPPVESPPATPVSLRDPIPDPREQLFKLASELIRTNNRRLLVEYLRLRRTIK